MSALKERLSRQLDLIPLEALGHKITIVGAGAVGSFTALTLAKMGLGNLTVFDDDTIEIHNMNCQFYRTEDIEKLKVEALLDLVKSFTDVEITGMPIRFDSKKPYPATDIMISAVDSMSARKDIWEAAKKHPTCKWFIDARMGGESILFYTMNPKDEKDIKAYETTLYTDENAVAERCTMKATMYTVNLIAGLIGKSVKDIITGAPNYSRIVTWAVKENSYLGFTKELK